MPTVFLSLGSNLGNRRRYMEKMLQRLDAIMKQGMKISQVMETEPVGMSPLERRSWFLNLVVRGVYPGSAPDLLVQCNRIEHELGRVREKPMASRTADIDILLFGHEIINGPALIVPHPRILERRFCLEGLCRIAPCWKIPGTSMTIGQHYRTMSGLVRKQKINFLHKNVHYSR
jgi:2-amino-4-hydroxy-6-hydroxymethyldihydropteridine diphosphokinase